MRSLVGAIAVALSLYWLGVVFRLNGDQWTWWQFAAWSGAALCLIVALARMTIAGVMRSGRRRGVFVPAGLLGFLLLSGSLALMASRYSDPYAGPLFWPHVLALVGFVGFVLLIVAAVARSERNSARSRSLR